MGGTVNLPDSSALVVVYDLRDTDQWQAAHRHRATWGKVHSDIHALSYDHIALVFRSAGERWRPWERVRLEWILKDRERVA
jgi:hypothetical protein